MYKHHGPDRPGEPLPEDGYVMPRRLYGISKLASELITERYADLFGFSAASVRPSSVYGSMDRVTASRNFRHAPNRVAHMAVEGVQRVRVNTLAAGRRLRHVEDVAQAIVALLRAPALRYSAYNIAAGSTATLGDLVTWAAEKAPGFHAEVVPAADADILQDETLNRRNVGRLRHCQDPRRDRLEAAPGARGAARIHGLDRGAARLMTPSGPYPRDLIGYAAHAAAGSLAAIGRYRRLHRGQLRGRR